MSHLTIAVDEAERALAEACRRGHAEVVAFTVAPRRRSEREPWDGHDWLIEFADPPRAPGVFARVLDESLCRLHGTLAPPRVIELPAGTFHGRSIPRVTTDRAVADGLIAIAGTGRVPLLSVGP